MALLKVSGEVGVVRFGTDDVRFTTDGKCWVKFRGVTKDRKRDSNGTWSDGEPLFLDYLLFGKYAEHFIDSVSVGDLVNVTGTLAPNNWTTPEGVKREEMKVMVDSIGPSLAMTPVRTPRTLEAAGVTAVAESLGGTVVDDGPPF
jgi:single-stranded DNA-binding protein